MKKYVFIACALIGAGSMQAQNKWTLRQCIDYAIENNIEIKQQALNVENADIDLNTSKNSRLPDFSASVSQGFGFDKARIVPTADDKQNNVDDVFKSLTRANTGFGLSTSVPLFTGFRIQNEIKSKELNLLASTEGLKKAKENLELQVTSYFLEVLFKKELLKINEEQVKQTEEQVGKTQILVDGGKVPLAQLYDVRAQLAKDELNVTNAKNDLILSTLNLSQALNLLESSEFDVVTPNMQGDVIGDNLSSILPPRQIYEQAITIKPHVKEKEYTLEGSRKDLGVAKSGYWPTLNLQASHNMGYNHTYGRAGNNQASFNKQIKNSSSQYIGFSLNIPIFDRFLTRNRVKMAKLNIDNRALELDNVKLALFKEIQQAYQSAIAAQAKYSSTEKAFESARESYKYAEERYAVGKMTVFEMNEAKLKLLSSQSEQIQSKYDFLFRAKILDFYRGAEIDIN